MHNKILYKKLHFFLNLQKIDKNEIVSIVEEKRLLITESSFFSTKDN